MFIYIHILSYYKLFLYFNLYLSVKLDSLSYLFTSTFFPTNSICYGFYFGLYYNELELDYFKKIQQTFKSNLIALWCNVSLVYINSMVYYVHHAIID
jgi:hypothetical protein